MVGPFKRAQGCFTHLFVAIDKFSKWIEAKPVATITTMHRFGVPNKIITNNGTQFTGRSPFFLVYGAEAMLLSEMEFESLRFRNFNEECYDQDCVEDLNQLEEAREAALIQSARIQGLWRYHNRNVRSRAFIVGDMVLRKIQTTRDRHKLSSLWEELFIISKVTRPGAYRLKHEDGSIMENSWNIEHLRCYYT